MKRSTRLRIVAMSRDDADLQLRQRDAWRELHRRHAEYHIRRLLDDRTHGTGLLRYPVHGPSLQTSRGY